MTINWLDSTHFLTFNTDTKNAENLKKYLKHHKNWISANFLHLVPVYLVKKNGVKNSKNRHLRDLSGIFYHFCDSNLKKSRNLCQKPYQPNVWSRAKSDSNICKILWTRVMWTKTNRFMLKKMCVCIYMSVEPKLPVCETYDVI